MKKKLLSITILAATALSATAVDKLLVVGDATWGGWSLDQTAVMVKTGDNPEIFTYTGYLNADKEFKFLTEAQWDRPEYRNASADAYISGDGRLQYGGDDYKFKVSESANYTVTCNLTDMTINVSKAAYQALPVKHNVLYLVGDATDGGWDLGLGTPLAMSATDPMLFEGRVSLKTVGDNGRHATFKIATNRYGGYAEQKFYFRDAASDAKVSEDGTDDRQWSVDSDGIYDVSVNLASMTVSIINTDRSAMRCWYEPAGASPVEHITVYYNASGDLFDYPGDVYVHTGAITDQRVSNSDWKYSSGWCDNDPKYRMTRSESNPNLYTLDMVPMDFYGLQTGDELRALAFVMRNDDGSKCGRGDDGSDIIVPFANGLTAPAAKPLGGVLSWSTDGPVATIVTENGRLMLTAYTDRVVKVFSYIEGSRADERRSISVNAVAEGSFNIHDAGDKVLFSTGGVIAEVSKADSKIRFTDNSGKVILAERGGLDNSTVPRRISFDGMGDRAFYGGGYNGKRVDQNGTTLVMNNTQTGGWDCTWEAPHNICIPFVVSTSGYGLLVDDHYRHARLTPSADGTEYESGSRAPVSYYFIGSDDGSMESVLDHYTRLTGRQELPPYWALGYMTSRYGYKTRGEAEEVVKSIKDAGLPLDAIVFDLYWQGEGNSGMGNLDWYAPNWPNATDMMAGFNDKGVKTICITEPFFTSVASENYGYLKSQGWFADDDVSNMWWLGADKVGLIDSSNPDAMDWMWQAYRNRTTEGVAGWWLDLGEPESHDSDSYHLGGSVSEIHNEFSDLWLERVYRGFKEEFPDVRPFLMPRAGTAGMQRHSAFPWSGDIRRSWDGLRAQIPALLSSGMSGVAYMGSDISGFATEYDGHTDSWLYLRWIQFATFSPMFRTHSTYKPEPYHSEYSDVFEHVRRFINMRYSYLPYTYSLTWENATKGTPLARPVNFHDKEGIAPSPANCTDSYLWGRDIFVAPILDFATGHSREITFPQGDWVDLNDMSKTYAGGTTVTYQGDLGTLPHFGRCGSFITRFTQTDFDHTGNIDNTRLTVTYLRDLKNEGAVESRMFDDDHTSTTSLADNQVLMTTFTGRVTSNGHSVSVSHSGAYAGMPQEREYTIVIPGYTGNVTVTSDGGAPMAKKAVASVSTGGAADSYTFENGALVIRAKIPTDATRTFSINDITTGAVATTTTGQTMLEHSATTNTFSYTMPAESTGSIRVFSVTGTEICSYDNLRGSGAVGQLHHAPLATGMYIASLNVNNPDGTANNKTIKMTVR